MFLSLYLRRGEGCVLLRFLHSLCVTWDYGSRILEREREGNAGREWTGVGRVFVEFHVGLTIMEYDSGQSVMDLTGVGRTRLPNGLGPKLEGPVVFNWAIFRTLPKKKKNLIRVDPKLVICILKS